MSGKKIANKGSIVIRHDGVQLYGLDAELEKKARQKRDTEFEKKILNWVQDVAGEPRTEENIDDALISGVLLCKMMNKIEPGCIPKIDTRDIPLVHVENINKYLKACWNLGVPSSDMFVTSDLFQRRGLLQVVQNLHSVARLCQVTCFQLN